MDGIDADERAARYQAIVQQFQNRNRHTTQRSNQTTDENTIKFYTLFRNVIYDVLLSRGYTYTTDECEWNLMWCDKMYIRAVYQKIYLANNQCINHFRNFYELCRKDLLIKNLRKYKKLLLQQCRTEIDRSKVCGELNFWPDTYILPQEYYMFVQSFKQQSDQSTAYTPQYIMKPIASSQGKGIFLFSKLSQIAEWKIDYRSILGNNNATSRQRSNSTVSFMNSSNTTATPVDDDTQERYIVQRYIDRPLCVGGKKFDMRIYALVTSYTPLTVWLYRDGFARFASTRFSMTSSDLNNNLVHLTNVAIQKHGDLYDADNSGGKMDLTALKRYLCSKYGRVATDQAFMDIESVILHSLHAVQPHMINDSSSFELYGYDILLDSTLKPWLIEVNGSPSLTANTQHDKCMKQDMLHDMLTIIDMEHVRTGTETQVGGFDLLYDSHGRRQPHQRHVYSSMLGNAVADNRANNLKSIRRNYTAATTL